MFATKFISSFPSSENIILPHLATRDLHSDIGATVTLELVCPSSSSALECGVTSSRQPLESPPLIEDDDYSPYSPFVPFTIVVEQCSSSTPTSTSTRSSEHLEQTEQTEQTEPADDEYDPKQVQSKVAMLIYQWGPSEPINPEQFFLDLLASRGYDNKLVPALTSQYNR